MTASMYCLYVGVDYTYIDINALAQGIKSFLASDVWFQSVAGARTYGTDSPALLVSHANHSATEISRLYVCVYVCMYVCMHVYICIFIHTTKWVHTHTHTLLSMQQCLLFFREHPLNHVMSRFEYIKNGMK